MMTFDRRRLLQCSCSFAASSIASAALLTAARAQSIDAAEEEEDHGYDLEAKETLAVDARLVAAFPKPPPRFVVDPAILPPVGDQGGVGSCVSWSAGYGLATAMLARKLKRDPAIAANQISPAYLYSTVRNAMASGCTSDADVLEGHCKGKTTANLGKGDTNIGMTLAILSKWGSVSAEECPYPKTKFGTRRVVSGALYNSVYTAWSATRAEPTITISNAHTIRVDWERPDELNKLKTVLSRNEPFVYGTRLPKAWKAAQFDPGGRPWDRYRDIATKSDGKPAGHAMLVIGYDDEMEAAGGGRGAILLQNSWGQDWGMSWSDAFARQYPNLPVKQGRGYVWITYEAFRALAKSAFSIEV